MESVFTRLVPFCFIQGIKYYYVLFAEIRIYNEDVLLKSYLMNFRNLGSRSQAKWQWSQGVLAEDKAAAQPRRPRLQEEQ